MLRDSTERVVVPSRGLSTSTHGSSFRRTGDFPRYIAGVNTADDTTFRPPGDSWNSVSPKLATARRIMLAPPVFVASLAASVLALLPDVPFLYPIAVIMATVLLAGWAWWLIGRRVRSFGYAERADDLLVTSGIMFRRLVIVPLRPDAARGSHRRPRRPAHGDDDRATPHRRSHHRCHHSWAAARGSQRPTGSFGGAGRTAHRRALSRP